MKIDFDEEKHEYSVGGVKVPSVSEILAPLSADRYRDLNPAVLQQAAARGTAIHEATEALDYDLNPEIMPDIAGYVEAYIAFLRDYFPQWEKVEGRVCAENAKNAPIYAGTVDRYGKIDGRPCVVDIKTYASMTTDALIAASCQTQLYRCAIDNNYTSLWHDMKRYVLHLKKDGNYRLIDLDKFDDERNFNSYDVAFMLLRVWIAREDARNAKGRKK